SMVPQSQGWRVGWDRLAIAAPPATVPGRRPMILPPAPQFNEQAPRRRRDEPGRTRFTGRAGPGQAGRGNAYVPSRPPGPAARHDDLVRVPLLGGREAVDALTPTLDHIVIDRGHQIAEGARAVQLLRQRVPAVTFVDNHFAGYAPET